MVRTLCPQCQTTLPDDAVAGAVLPCSHCGTLLRVPDAMPAPPPPHADPGPQEGVESIQVGPTPAQPWSLPQSHPEGTREDWGRPGELEVLAEEVAPQDAEVLAELERLQYARPGWWGALAILAVSLFLYVGAAQAERTWDSVVILVAVLAFHEFGHYVAMRAFGYRNLRMFFIPFFGAAVSGRHYNVAGWKKAVVALAGPLPGILIGVPLGVAGLALREPKVVEVAVLLLILNGFNLLPFLPLDGGWVLHAVLFVRHPALDVVFRLVAALGLLGLALLLGAWLLAALAVFMLLAIPIAWRLANVAHRLREQGLVALSSGADTIPPEVALAILAELRPSLPPQTSPKLLAQNVANVFEALNASPPGVLASLGLLGLHGGSFLLALVMSVVLTVLRHRLG